MSECSLCLDHFDQQAVSCIGGLHRFCKACFTKYVSAECDCMNSRALPLITCPYVPRGQCISRPFTNEFIAGNVDPETFSKYVAVQKQRVTIYQARSTPTTVNEYRIEVIELLNPACPQCHAAFIDFSGCCALTCRLCTCRFCAYCMQANADNIHGHVEGCRYRDVNNWRRGQLKWTRDRIVALLKPLPKRDRRRVLDGCHVYLKDLDIDVSSMQRALGL